ncbi:MAG: hypothetical protein [Caudoviricetes sp.]|nr:MAG: hypothetical protein [Caudoviricetes sp.]
MKRNRVNVLTVVNSASNITTETIDGDEHIIVRDIVPIVDDIVMNGGLYPAAEINKSYKSLEGKAMPFGHPKVDGKHVSANNPRAINQFNVGAWSKNVRKDGDKVKMDMYVNKRVAMSSKHGPDVIAALEALRDGKSTDPIHVSTGLDTMRVNSSGTSRGKRHNWIATNQVFDHTAILLYEPGAGTPNEGVGIFVNSDGDEQQIEVANLADASDCTREGMLNKTKFFFTNASNFSFDDIQRAISDKLREGDIEDKWLWPETVWPDSFIYQDGSKNLKQKYLIDDGGKAVFVGEPVEVVRKPTEYEIKTNGAENPMKDMIVNALKAKGKPTEGKTDAELFDAFNQMNAEEAAKTETPEQKAAREKKESDEKDAKDKATNSEEMPAWAKLLTEQVSALNTQFAANSDKEKGEKRAAVKAKFNMTDLAVNALDGEPLKELYAQCQTSTGLSGAFRQVNSNQSFSEMPE